TLFDYAIYDPTNELPFTSFKSATGATNIALALETAIDKLIAIHGVGGAAGSEIYLLSDGVQTTGSDLFDEVERANGQGIKIHTLSFGNADSDTMDAIAEGSGGSNTLMSERDDAAELKMVMTDKFETGRGRTELFVLKGVIPEAPRVYVAGREIFEAEFSVPPRSQDLQFYVFSPTGDPSVDLSLQLQSPSGAIFDSLPPNNVAKLGRFNAIRVAGPELGLWKYRLISTGANLPSDEVEVAIYAQNRELDTAVFIEGPDLGKVLIRSQLHFRYPLTKLAVRADIYHRGQLVAQIPLADDGAPGIDGYGEDGVYAGLVDLGASGDARLDFAIDNGARKLRVKVELVVVAGTAIPAPLAHYETGISQSEIDADYAAGNESSFSAWGEAMIQTSEPEGQGPLLGTSLPSTVPTVISRGQDSSFDLVIDGARPLADQLRVSLGQGIAVTVAPLPSPPTGNLQTRVRVHLSVATNATIGSRNLAVQFGNEILTLTAALEIQAANDVPALKSASKLLLMLTLATVAVALARRWRHA
ncbi:MAG: VWA domain-containing protein, partial [Myxococcota bacterium]